MKRRSQTKSQKKLITQLQSDFSIYLFPFFCLILLGPSVKSKFFAIFLTLLFFPFFRLSKMMRNDTKPVLSYVYVFYIHFNQPAKRFESDRRKGGI